MGLAESTIEDSFASSGLVRTPNCNPSTPMDPWVLDLLSGWSGSASWSSVVRDLTSLTVRLGFLFMGLFEFRNVTHVRLRTRINEIYIVIEVDL